MNKKLRIPFFFFFINILKDEKAQSKRFYHAKTSEKYICYFFFRHVS